MSWHRKRKPELAILSVLQKCSTFFLFILHIVSIQKKEVKKIMENKKAKTLSATSIILLTIYTIFMVLTEVWMFSICNFVTHMINSGVDIASSGITSDFLRPMLG